MKILFIVVIAIFGVGFTITNNPASANNSTQNVIIDGTISEEGCKVINGVIMQELDIQNTPIQVCDYHSKHFKLSTPLDCPLTSVGDTRDPETGQKFSFNSICDEPTTCGLKNSWGGYNLGNSGNTDWLNASTINGTRFFITTNYDEGICLSEAYSKQEKKITIIADGLWKNDTVVNVLSPKILLANTGVIVDGQKIDSSITDHNPNNNTLICKSCYYTMNIHLSSSHDSKKIEIGAVNVESPLKQFKSGIAANSVKCSDGLVLVIKSEDGLPACVKPDTAQRLIERGWAIIPNLSQTNNIAENVCGKFFTAPGSQNYSNTIPVLLMNSNSTACAKLTFTIISDYKNCNGQSCPHVLAFDSTMSIGNLHYEKHGSMMSISSGKSYANSFKITAIPEMIDLANYPVGANFTVTYIIKPLSNATGFYDQSIPRLACERYPLAVGHTADQVNASDFSYIDPLNPPCAAGSFVLTGVEISGMDYKEVTRRLSTLG